MWSVRKKLRARLKVGRFQQNIKSLTSWSLLYKSESLKYEIFFRPRVRKILVKTSVEVSRNKDGAGVKS